MSDREWDEWVATWHEGTPSPVHLGYRLVRERRRLRLAVALTLPLLVVAMGVALWQWAHDPGPTHGPMLVVAITVFAAAALLEVLMLVQFPSPKALDTRGYVRAWLARCTLGLRFIRLARGLIVIGVTIAVVITALRLWLGAETPGFGALRLVVSATVGTGTWLFLGAEVRRTETERAAAERAWAELHD